MMRARIGWFLLTVGSLGIFGCDDNSPGLCQPGVLEGRIEGAVRTGGTMVDAKVRATRVRQASGGLAYFESVVGPTGLYAIRVPAGDYVVGIHLEESWLPTYEYSAAGLRFGDAPPDTLVVDPQQGTVQVDFELANLRATLQISPLLDGETAIVALHRRGMPSLDPWRSYPRGAGGTVVNGAVGLVVGGVLPGQYKVEWIIGRQVYSCACPHDGEHFWVPGVQDSAQSPWVDVPANRTTAVAARIQTEPARIQGRIRGAWLDFGLDPPTLAIFGTDSTIVRGARPVAADGTFDDAILLPGAVKLLVSQDGINQWIGGDDFTGATTFTLQAGQVTSGIEFVQSGMILDVTVPGLYVQWGRFSLYDASTASLAVTWLLQNESDLVFAIPNLRPGTYRMHIDPYFRGREPWAPQWYDRVTSQAQARTITIGQPGDVARIPVVLERGGTIGGIVREDPASNTTIYIYVTPADARTHWGLAYAFAGRRAFKVEGLPDGDWKIGASRVSPDDDTTEPPANTLWYPGTTDWQAASRITTRDFEDITGIDIVVPNPGGP